MICSRCATQMQPGIAMAQTYAGSVTMYPAGPGQVIQCLKCPQCGHSTTYPLPASTSGSPPPKGSGLGPSGH